MDIRTSQDVDVKVQVHLRGYLDLDFFTNKGATSQINILNLVNTVNLDSFKLRKTKANIHFVFAFTKFKTL